MPENNKPQEFLQKLAPCIELGNLDACVEEAVRLAQEMGVGAEELLELSTEERRNDKYHFSYMIALAAAQRLEGEAKAQAYSNAGLALQCAENIQKAEEYYQKSIEIDPKYAEAHSNYAYFLKENAMFFEAEKEVRIALQIEPENPYDLRTYGDILADEDYNQLDKFKAGPIEFKKITERRTQPSEAISKLSVIHDLHTRRIQAQFKPHKKPSHEEKSIYDRFSYEPRI